MIDVIIVGGGPAGLMATYSALMQNKKVLLIEKNNKLGKKLYITGKGRCNLSNASTGEEFFKNIVTNPKFLFASFASFSSEDTQSFFEENGLKLKIERGNRIFPESDKASDVTKVFEKIISKNNVEVKLETTVLSILTEGSQVKGVLTDKGEFYAKSIIIATGGVSYPLTGSTGDGYLFAKQVGHSIVEPKPALVGIETKKVYADLQGLSLKNVVLHADNGKKTLFNELGEMLFTHYGISGPIVLSCSSILNKVDLNNVNLYIDLKPALDFNTLEQRLIREFKENNLKSLTTILGGFMPKSLIVPFLKEAKLNGNKICAEITVFERNLIINTLKKFPLTPKKLRPIDEAIITSGGINVKEVNPKTLESKFISGLFFAGEVLDVDALTGGYNIQIAFSTGYLAGQNA